jgi:hypothetical protein
MGEKGGGGYWACRPRQVGFARARGGSSSAVVQWRMEWAGPEAIDLSAAGPTHHNLHHDGMSLMNFRVTEILLEKQKMHNAWFTILYSSSAARHDPSSHLPSFLPLCQLTHDGTPGSICSRCILFVQDNQKWAMEALHRLHATRAVTMTLS